MKLDWHVGDVVRKLRDERHWNQDRLAKAAGIHKTTVVRVEQNVGGVTRESYEKIATALKLSLGELFSMVPLPPESVPRKSSDEVAKKKTDRA